MDNRSQTRANSVLLLFTKDTKVHLILYGEILNQLQNCIMRESVLLLVLVVPALSLYNLLTRVMRIKLALGSVSCIRVF